MSRFSGRTVPALRVGLALAGATAIFAASSVLAQNLADLDRVPGVAPPRDPQFIYSRVCGYCHGHAVAPLIRGRNLPPQLVEYFVRHGQGAMPAFKPTEITDQELAALARWLSTSEADPKEHGQ